MSKTPIEKAEGYLSEVEEMLATVKYIEDPKSENRFPEVIGGLRSEFEALMLRDPRSLPLPLEFYRDLLRAKEFIFMIFSSSPKREEWSYTEIQSLADFFEDKQLGDLRLCFWDLVDEGLVELLPNHCIKPTSQKAKTTA